MSLEKPWKKPFDSLLEMLVGIWGGEISNPQDDSSESSLFFEDPSLFTYPRLSSSLGNYAVTVEIKEYPLGDVRPYDGTDGVQFLTIRLFFKTEHNVLIRREHLTDKIWKTVGLEREYESGNNDFDKSYFLDVKAKCSEALVRSVDFQNAITGLEPFTTVRIRPTGLGWSQEIRKKTQLEHLAVGQYANRLLDLVRFLKRLELS